jgi:S-adenosylmethionine:tRNA ribosyltransferase-isomerase
MHHPYHISIIDYNYPLPEDRIAKYPLPERDKSKLLVFNGQITETTFQNISSFLPAPALLVANNTKVIKARMEFFKSTGARIEVFCLEPWLPLEYSQMFAQNNICQWVCYVGNSKKWKDGQLTKKMEWNNRNTELTVKKIKPLNDAFIIEFTWDNPLISFGEILDLSGEIPIPPYLNRASEELDTERYQTVYSHVKGSVAAPTAGLHFTENVFESLEKKGIRNHQITLHVGAGTFKPVQSEQIKQHPMHTEHFILSREILKPLIENKDPLIAVGTTTVRALESIYWIGVKIIENQNDPFHINQWEAYELNNNVSKPS